IYFETGSSTIKPASRHLLDDFARFLERNNAYRIVIQGHTDNIGDGATNLVLSEKRAQVVREYLVSKGIATGRVDSKGFGDTMPLAPNDSAKGRAKNRRTEFVLNR
ncbi:MAG: OmpA family protein, partial [Bacteroidota bacterium]